MANVRCGLKEMEQLTRLHFTPAIIPRNVNVAKQQWKLFPFSRDANPNRDAIRTRRDCTLKIPNAPQVERNRNPINGAVALCCGLNFGLRTLRIPRTQATVQGCTQPNQTHYARTETRDHGNYESPTNATDASDGWCFVGS